MTPSPDLARSILLVEDDTVFRGRLARAFRERGFDVREADDGETALRLAEAETPEYVLVDLRMPGMPGLEVVRALHALDPTTAVVVLTGYGSIATAVEAIRFGARHYLTKPADVDDILAAFDGGNETARDVNGEDHVPSLARVEWEHINRVLVDCEGNISKAAKLLGLHRRSLQRKLAKYPTTR